MMSWIQRETMTEGLMHSEKVKESINQKQCEYGDLEEAASRGLLQYL